MSTFRIACPNCGERLASEYSYGGESIPYPADPTAETLEANYDRVWLRDNSVGRQTEQWFHSAGCRRWITVDRNTLTNEAFCDQVGPASSD